VAFGIRISALLFGGQCLDGKHAPFAVINELQTTFRVPTQGVHWQQA
jgi:hypothetical protein